MAFRAELLGASLNPNHHVSIYLDGCTPLDGDSAAFLFRLGRGIAEHGPVIIDVAVSGTDGVPELSAIASGALVPTLGSGFVASVKDVSMLQWLRAQPDGCEIRQLGSTIRWRKVPSESHDPTGSIRVKRQGRVASCLIFETGVPNRFRPVRGAFGLAASTPWLRGTHTPQMLAEESVDTGGSGTSCCALLLGIPPTRQAMVEGGRIAFEGPGFAEAFDLADWLAIYRPAEPNEMYRSVILGEAVGIREILQPLDGRVDTSPRVVITAVRRSDEIRKLARRRMREGLQPWLSHCGVLPASRHAPDAIQDIMQDQRCWLDQCRPEVAQEMRRRLRSVLDCAGKPPSGIMVLG
jgi:hypothetical protein